jgi:hypothetical protein
MAELFLVTSVLEIAALEEQPPPIYPSTALSIVSNNPLSLSSAAPLWHISLEAPLS